MFKTDNKFLYLIFAGIGFIYLRSGYGKLTGGQFVNGLAGTLDKFASKNPYLWVANFLHNVAIPNSTIFGWLTMSGELFAGITMGLLSIYLLANKNISKTVGWLLLAGMLVGAFLNLVFWFSAGWTSSSTESLNLVMFIVEAVGVIYVFKWITSR